MADLPGSTNSVLSDDLIESDSNEQGLGCALDADRLEQLSRYLRKDPNLKDASIVVSGKEIPVHSAVIASLSSFFATAFCGAFSESASMKLVLQDAPVDAVHVIISYAYGEDVEERLADLDLAMEVWQLAHRYQIDGLRAKAAEEVLQCSAMVGWVSVLKHANLYGSRSEQATAKKALASNFVPAAKGCSDFDKLPFNDLLNAITSKELIAEEHEKFGVLLKWARANNDCSQENLLNLFSHVHFQLFEKEQVLEGLPESDLLPKAVLANAWKQSLQKGISTSGHFDFFRGQATYDVFGNPLDIKGDETEFLITANKDCNGGNFYFSFRHWAMSATTMWTDDEIELRMFFHHRLRQEDTSGEGTSNPFEGSFQEELSKYEFIVRVKRIAERICDRTDGYNYTFARPVSNCIGMDLNSTIFKEQSFLETIREMKLTDINIWVSIQCKKLIDIEIVQ